MNEFVLNSIWSNFRRNWSIFFWIYWIKCDRTFGFKNTGQWIQPNKTIGQLNNPDKSTLFNKVTNLMLTWSIGIANCMFLCAFYLRFPVTPHNITIVCLNNFPKMLISKVNILAATSIDNFDKMSKILFST